MQKRSRVRVTVLGNHPLHGGSMLRYTNMLVKAYEEAGADVRVLRPPGALSANRRSRSAAKLLKYLEQLVVFPVRVQFSPRRVDHYHVADHSDSPWTLIPRVAGRTDVTCHDLTAVRAALGEFGLHRPGMTGRLQQGLIRTGLRRARKVVAVSRATEGDVLRLVPGVPTAVLVNPVAGPLLDATADGAAERAGGPYVVMVINDAWYKRRPLGLRMWHRLRQEQPGLRLVVVGPPFRAEDVEAAGLTAEWPELQPSVEFAHGVDDAGLAAIYRGAEALIQSSAHEGFCWPVAEANTCGTIAICTDIPVLREVGPHNLFLPDPDDLEPLAGLWAQRNDPERLKQAEAHARSAYAWSGFVETLGSLMR